MRRGLATAFLGVLALALPASAQALVPSTPDRTAFGANGQVSSIARANGITYLGGDFGEVHAPTGPAARLNATTGMRFSTFPQVTGGNVHASAPDGSGGYYIGGEFTAVGGVARNRIAHVLSSGAVDPNFNPDSQGPVHALAVSGSVVYAGGEFSNIGGLARQNIAKLSATSGNAFSAWHPSPNSQVLAIAVSSSGVYIGGMFSHVNMVEHQGIARISATTGNVFSGFNSSNDGGVADIRVFSLAATASGVYVGGRFSEMGGLPRNNIAKVSSTSGNAFSAWNPSATFSDPGLVAVRAIAVDGSSVYAGGLFDNIGSQAHDNIAKLSASTGNAVGTWDPDADAPVHALALSSSTLYAGGFFGNIGGQQRTSIAKLSTTSGNAFATFNPNPDAGVLTVSVSGTSVLAGGGFTVMNRMSRDHVAALDVNGVPTAFNPGADQRVSAIAVSGSSVYLGGSFTTVGGVARERIAKLSTGGVVDTGWNPGADSNVLALALFGDSVYAGGEFEEIGGEARDRIAKLLVVDGTVAPTFTASADNSVHTLAVSPDGLSLYAGGAFGNISGVAEPGVGKLSATSGADDPAFDANCDDTVRSLALTGSSLYLGGDFNGPGSLGGQERNRVARVSATNGALTSWNPNANANVQSISPAGSAIYVGGEFTAIGGLTRNKLAALSATSGNAFSTFNPNLLADPGEDVLATEFDGSTLYAGGNFTTVGGRPRTGFAQFTTP